MSAHAIEFLQKWIDEEIQPPAQPAKVKEHAVELARECCAKAVAAGIPLEELQEEVGDIQDLVEAKLEDAVEASQANGGEHSES